MDHARVPPKPLRLHFLEEITDNFSQERKLGVGAYGSVYKGQCKDGEKIAVKKLHDHMAMVNDELFEKEYLNLANLEHQNIVKLVGYCIEIRKEYVEFDGRMVRSEIQHMALCFEFMCNGSLANYLQDESTGEDWPTRYAIIRGICKGLKYLHEELNPPVYHLDLKPDNILLDEQMTPKIADFGMSKIFGDERTRVSASVIGTIGYLPPEYIDHNVVSNKLDIFSLGVIIIKLMMGPVGYSQVADMSSEKFIELTHGKWIKRLQQTSNNANESDAEQVKTCIKIALSCVEHDRRKRPNIGDIVSELDHTDTTAQFSHALTINQRSMAVEEEKMSPLMSTKSERVVDAPEFVENEMLNVHPRQLRFPIFKIDKSISCPLSVSNKTDAHVAFRVLLKHPERYIDGLLKLSGIVPPKSTRTYLVLMEQPPPERLDEFDVTLESCIAHTDIADVDDNFLPDIIELTEGNKLHEVTLVAIILNPARANMTSESIGTRTKIICNINGRNNYIVSMDTHLGGPWIVAGHNDGSISIWNYVTQVRLKEFKVTRGAVRAIRLIARKQWIVSGDGLGQIHVHSFVTTEEVKNFQPHFNSSWVEALAAHPNLPLLLSSSEDKLIKLWDWQKGWMCLRTFKENTCFGSIMFNPNNDSTGSISFTSVSMHGIAKIWKTSHPLPIATYDCKSAEQVLCFDYLPQLGGGNCIVTGSKAGHARIWDLKTQKCVQHITGLQTGYGFNVCVVDCSPDLPLLAVALQDNSIGLYNPTTTRYDKILMHKFGRIRRLDYINAIQSVAIGHEGGLALLEIH